MKETTSFFNDGKFKNDLKDIPWENSISQGSLLTVKHLICFSNKLIPC